jgi:equilibrative nucleoside transporter 1/2/3
MFYQGVGNLFPWNAFISAFSYFSNRFCGTPFELNFENYFSISFSISGTIGLFLSIMYQDKIRLKHKIVWPLICYSSVFCLTTLLVTQEVEATLLFWITFLSTCICGLCGAILSGGLYGLAAMLPDNYTAALMNGSGLAGFVVSLSSILTLLAEKSSGFCDNTEETTVDCIKETSYSALAYFIIATFILLTCASSIFYLLKQPFARFA